MDHPHASVTTEGAHSHRQQLSDDVATYVREMIIAGRMRPGDFLRAEPIAAAVGVSNTPVREGLLRLSGEGFVELVPRRGFVVSAFSQRDVRDIFWAQASLAGELASRAAKNISKTELDRLAAIADRHRAAIESDSEPDETVALGHEFHRTINLAADSRRLAMLLRTIVKQLPNRFYSSIEGHAEGAVRDHPAILAALRGQDAALAGQLMRDHIMSGADELIRMLDAQGVWARTSA